MAERLPIADGAADNVALNSSLDHILDYHLAVDEAVRILKPGGMFYMNSLIWTMRAELFPDTVHFHHFRDFELRGALKALRIEEITRYSWKGDSHRYGVYLAARKP
jgi:ubiquinone/menaquinone biosynthesis C-methylase UbiE